MEVGRIKIGVKSVLIDGKQIGIKKSDFSVWDNFSRLAVLTIISGYLKSDHIMVNESFAESVSIKNLNHFLSYTLNHHIAPKKFNVSIATAPALGNSKPLRLKKFSKFNAILAFSGGLDSTAGLLYARDRGHEVLPLWIDFGQRNRRAERASVLKSAKQLGISLAIIRLNLNRYIMAGWKEWNFIVPGRNFLFLSLANSLLRSSASTRRFIYLCAHKDEMAYAKNRDKSRYFFARSSRFFSQDTGCRITAASPFAKYSKTEVISYWRRHWEKKYGVSPLDTSTCYYSRHCGRCEACLKRSVQLLAAGYPAKTALDYPFSDPAGIIKERWIPRIKRGQMSRNNKLDFIIALEKNLRFAAPYVKEFYAALPARLFRSVQRRKKEIESAKIV